MVMNLSLSPPILGVKVSIEDRTIFLKVNGDIFKFNNIVGSAFIYLNSSPF